MTSVDTMTLVETRETDADIWVALGFRCCNTLDTSSTPYDKVISPPVDSSH